MTRVLRWSTCVVGACALLFLAGAGGPVASAVAEPPNAAPDVQITAPLNGSATNLVSPVISGTTDDIPIEEWPGEVLFSSIEVSIYRADDVSGEPVQTLPPTTPSAGGEWSASVAQPLVPGAYTALAKQTDLAGQGSSESSFTVDTSAPRVTLTAPSAGVVTSGGSVALAGTAGSEPGDVPTVAVRLFTGAEAGQTPTESLVVPAEGGVWSGVLGGLAPGTYTILASQGDTAGNTGTSAPTTFIVGVPASASGPTASFTWVPAAPVVGEAVSLVSTSTDLASPMTGFEWGLTAAAAPFVSQPVLSTTFTSPGAHLVRLTVVDAAGHTSTANESVPVAARPTDAMVPFPVVRIAGSLTSRGARVKLLTVQAPIAALVTITCRGRGCATKSEHRFATASSSAHHVHGAVLLSFPRFERSYRAGAVLTILVTKAGELGKYTSFAIRRDRLPARSDACVVTRSSQPVPCEL
jgi:hypothetical protein